MVDSQLADSLPYRPHIPCISKSQAIKARRNKTPYPLVLETHAPFSESLGLLQIDHE
jgi:hypothetical protein